MMVIAMKMRIPMLLIVCLLFAWNTRRCPSEPQKTPAEEFRNTRADELTLASSIQLGSLRFRHPDPVKCAVFSPDGRMIASTCARRIIYIWAASTGTLLRQIECDDWYISAIAISPDSKVLAAAGGGIDLWEIETGKHLYRLKEPEREHYQVVSFSPDGKMIAAGSAGLSRAHGPTVDGQHSFVRLWEVATSRKLSCFPSGDVIEDVAFSPNGKLLGFASRDGSLCLCSLETGQTVHRMGEKGRGVTKVAFAPDGKTLACGDWAGEVKQWDVQKGIELRRDSGHRHAISSLAYTPDGKILLSGADHSVLRLCDPTTNREMAVFEQIPRVGWRGGFSPNGKSLAIWGADQTIHLWDLSLNQPISMGSGHFGDVLDIAIAPDNKTIASASQDGIRIWNASTGEELKWLRSSDEDRAVFTSFSPDGEKLVSGCSEGMIRIWNVVSGKEIYSIRTRDLILYGVAFSPDGNNIISAGPSGLEVWDTPTGQSLRRIGDHDKVREGRSRVPQGCQLLVSPTGDWIVLIEEGQFRMWEMKTGEEKPFPISSDKRIGLSAFSPDGRMLLTLVNTGSKSDQAICFWEIATRQERLRIRLDRVRCRSFSFSPDHRHLAGFLEDGTCRCWNVLTEKETPLIQRPPTEIRRICFSPDGSFLVSAGRDTTMRVWTMKKLPR
jgi:WD40 repeat protein